MQKIMLILLGLALTTTSIACQPPGSKGSEGTNQSPLKGAASPKPSPTPTPSVDINSQASPKSYHISGNIDEASQEGDVCDVSVPFTVPGTLKFEFKPTSATKGTYTYSGPFNATGSGPYEIDGKGKMLVSGKGCIMGNNCAEYSHDWTAKPIDPASCKPKGK